MKASKRISDHRTAAMREEDAAARSAVPQIAHLHATLADLHRSEVAKLESVHRAIVIAFGD